MSNTEGLQSNIHLKLSNGCLTIYCDEKFDADGITYENGQKLNAEGLFNLYRHQHYSIYLVLRLYKREHEDSEYLKGVTIPALENFLLKMMPFEELEKKKEEMSKYNEERFACEFFKNVLAIS
ncbi:hypothetical protein H6F38_14495 [Paenibacillus sp. EKM208P]|nr:hypothetical protein H6F38_14495 [Paenibacillus sp. EKM208P]